MSTFLHQTLQALSQSKCLAYARQDALAVQEIENKVQNFCLAHALPTVLKACACVWRGPSDTPEVLVFAHPSAGHQFVKGTIEAGEDPALAVLRELEEEAGLSLSEPGPLLGTLHHLAHGRPFETGPLEHQLWHLFLLPAPPDLPASWEHCAVGSAEEEGLIFSCFWQPLLADADIRGFAPVFQQVLQVCAAHLLPPEPFTPDAD